jgi:hypothetical protein
MHPAIVFVLSLVALMIAGRGLATAGQALGLPRSLVALLESLALR